MKKITFEIADADYFYLQAKYGKVSNFPMGAVTRSSIRKDIIKEHTSRKFCDLALYNQDQIPEGHEWYVMAMIHDENFYEGCFDTRQEYEEFNEGFDDPSDYYPTTD